MPPIDNSTKLSSPRIVEGHGLTLFENAAPESEAARLDPLVTVVAPRSELGEVFDRPLKAHHSIQSDDELVIAEAREHLISYLGALAQVDTSLAGMLESIPPTLRRTLESDAFRVRANARFKELAFLSAAAWSLSADELLPLTTELLGYKHWFPQLDPSEVRAMRQQ
jgi:hypothetical protein